MIRNARDEVHRLIIEGGKKLKTYRQTHRITPDVPDMRHTQLMFLAGAGRNEMMNFSEPTEHGIDEPCRDGGGHLLHLSFMSASRPDSYGFLAQGVGLKCEKCHKVTVVPLLDAVVALIKTGQDLGLLDEVPLLP